MKSKEAAQRVVELCRGLGFALAGVADASPTKWGRELREWLAAGKHGSMEYLAKRVEERLDPLRVLAGARSVVMVGDVYSERGHGVVAAAGEEHRRAGLGRGVGEAGEDDGPRVGGTGHTGKIARYARGRDYHDVIKKRLHALCDRLREEFPGEEFRAFVDTAPVLEREYAARAGLGWVGKHTLLIHPRVGSYLLLGGVLTTMELAENEEAVADHCGTCTRCIDACPTNAITPYSVDATRCISYLTIERREAIAEEFHGPIGDWMFGCDVCQEVCPHNSARGEGWEGARVLADYSPRRAGFDVLEVLGWTEEDRRGAFSGSSMKRATLAMMKRNAIIVAGNVAGRDPRVLQLLAQVVVDTGEPEMVRGTARAVLARLGRGG